MIKGALWKGTSAYVAGMERRFCVLVGTLILDFESEDDFFCGSPPKAEAEVIGAATWKGKNRPRGAHKEGFVYVTRLGYTNYCFVSLETDLEDWMLWMRTALDMALGVEGAGLEDARAGGISINRETLHRGVLEPPRPEESEVCSKSGVAFGLTQSRYNCSSCGKAFAQEHCSQRVPLAHHGFEEAVRVCDDCLAAQQLLAHLRFLSCMLAAHLHQRKLTRRGVRPAVVRSLGRKEEGGAKVLCNSLEVGIGLLEKGDLTVEEFGGLVKAEEGFQRDEAYNRVHAGCLSASTRLGDSTLAVVCLLHRGAASAPADEFRAVVMHLRMLAERDLDSIDFFWPQVLHAFYLLVPTVTAEGVFKAELLEDFILAMALKSTHLALKLIWWLKGYVEDLAGETAATSGKGAAGKKAHLVRLAIEVEDMVLSRADHASTRVRRRENRRKPPVDIPAAQQQQQQQEPGQTSEGVVPSEACSEASSPEATMPVSVPEEDQPEVTKTDGAASAAGREATEADGGESNKKMPDCAEREGAGTSGMRGGIGGDDEEDDKGKNGDIEGEEDGHVGGDGDEGPKRRRLLETLVRPTGAQSSLVGDEVLLLRSLRAAAAEHLGLDYVAKTAFADAGWWARDGEGGEDAEEDCCGRDGGGSEEGGGVWAELLGGDNQRQAEARYFEEQLTFVQTLVDIAERLRFVEPVSTRDDHLKRELVALAEEEIVGGRSRDSDGGGGDNDDCRRGADGGSSAVSPPLGLGDEASPEGRNSGDGGEPPRDAGAEAGADLEAGVEDGGPETSQRRRRTRGGARRRCVGYLPVCRATDPVCPIVRIPPTEGHVFKTKQRAPTLITCEIIVPEPEPETKPPTAKARGGPELLVAEPAELRGRSLARVVELAGSGGGEDARLRSLAVQGSTASPLKLEGQSSWGSDRIEVEEIIGTQVEPRGSLARSITDSKEEDSITSRENTSDLRSPRDAAQNLPQQQQRRIEQSDITTSADTADPGAVEKTKNSVQGFQEGEAFATSAAAAAEGGVEDGGTLAGVTTEPRGSNGGPSAGAEGPAAGVETASTSRGSEKAGRGSDDTGENLGGGVGGTEGPSAASSSQDPGSKDVSAARERGGNLKGFRGGCSSGGNGLRLPPPLEEKGGDDEAPTDGGGSASSERWMTSSSEVEEALKEHRGHQMLRRSPLAKSASATASGIRTNHDFGGSLGSAVGVNHAGEGGGNKQKSSEAVGFVEGLGGGVRGEEEDRSSASPGDGNAPPECKGVEPRGEDGLEGPRSDVGAREARRGGGFVEVLMERDGKEESVAISKAKALFAEGLISEEELEAVVSKDKAFTEVVEQHAFLDVQFCVSQAFGESWASKRARIKAASAEGGEPGWDLVSIIIKSNDDLRQEVCALQLIGLCKRIFEEASLDLFLQPYVIVSTGSSSGLVQCLTDAISVDSLKKNPNFVSLRDHFEKTYGEPGSKRFLEAQRNFVNSLAAYSLACYVLQIKDRHNGNILLDAEGRLIHIDFGFILGMAPGGNFALETCPFKLPTDYLDVMGGLESQAFMDFVVAFTCGFLTMQAHVGLFVKLLGMMTQKSPFPCFQGKDSPENIVKKLNDRLMPHLDKSETVAFCLDLIRESYNNYGQRQYDYYQWLANGIVA